MSSAKWWTFCLGLYMLTFVVSTAHANGPALLHWSQNYHNANIAIKTMSGITSGDKLGIMTSLIFLHRWQDNCRYSNNQLQVFNSFF